MTATVSTLFKPLNIWTHQFVEGDPKLPVVSMLLIQRAAGEREDFVYRNLRHAFVDDPETQDHLKARLDAHLRGAEVPDEAAQYLDECDPAMLVLDWGDEHEGDGLTLAEAMAMEQVGSDLWQLADGRKLHFLYTRAISSDDSEKVRAVYVGDQAITPLMEQIARDHLDDNFWNDHPKFPKADWAAEAENGDTWQSYPIWLIGQIEQAASEAEDEEADAGSVESRYLVADYWQHFTTPPAARIGQFITVRFVFDRETEAITHMERQTMVEEGRGRNVAWEQADAQTIADVENNLLHHSEVLYSHQPEATAAWSVNNTDELPSWAQDRS